VAFASEGGQDEAASRRRNLSKVKWKASGGIGGRATASAAISAKKYDDTFLQSTSKEGKNNAQTTFPALLLVSFLFFFLFFRISY
jgi:ABC-type Na+ efflux pump permease subunit